MPSRYRPRPVTLNPTRLAEVGSDPMTGPGKRRPAGRVLSAPAPMTPQARAAATAWIAAHLVDDPRHRVSVTALVRRWQEHAATLAINPGPRSELVAFILAAHPAARRRPQRNGRDPGLGDQLHGVASK